ncbi:MAG TPA: hypothetical protein VIP98_01080 [Microlunatus sp.]
MRERCGVAGVRRPALFAVAAVLLLAGCAPAATTDVQTAARDFQAAVRADDSRAACGMLSEQARSSLELTSARPCAAALTALKLPSGQPGMVEVWGDNAQARLSTGALFLAKYPAGWRISGAGCQRQPNQTYDCAVRS